MLSEYPSIYDQDLQLRIFLLKNEKTGKYEKYRFDPILDALVKPTGGVDVKDLVPLYMEKCERHENIIFCKKGNDNRVWKYRFCEEKKRLCRVQCTCCGYDDSKEKGGSGFFMGVASPTTDDHSENYLWLYPFHSGICKKTQEIKVFCMVYPQNEHLEPFKFDQVAQKFIRSPCDCATCSKVDHAHNIFDHGTQGIGYQKYHRDRNGHPLICLSATWQSKFKGTMDTFSDSQGNIGKYRWNRDLKCFDPLEFLPIRVHGHKKDTASHQILYDDGLRIYYSQTCPALNRPIYFARHEDTSKIQKVTFNNFSHQFEIIKCPDCRFDPKKYAKAIKESFVFCEESKLTGTPFVLKKGKTGGIEKMFQMTNGNFVKGDKAPIKYLGKLDKEELTAYYSRKPPISHRQVQILEPNGSEKWIAAKHPEEQMAYLIGIDGSVQLNKTELSALSPSKYNKYTPLEDEEATPTEDSENDDDVESSDSEAESSDSYSTAPEDNDVPTSEDVQEDVKDSDFDDEPENVKTTKTSSEDSEAYQDSDDIKYFPETSENIENLRDSDDVRESDEDDDVTDSDDSELDDDSDDSDPEDDDVESTTTAMEASEAFHESDDVKSTTTLMEPLDVDSDNSDISDDDDESDSESSEDSDSEDDDVTLGPESDSEDVQNEDSEADDDSDDVKRASGDSEALKNFDDVDVDSDDSEISDIDDESDASENSDSEDDDVESTATALEPSFSIFSPEFSLCEVLEGVNVRCRPTFSDFLRDTEYAKSKASSDTDSDDSDIDGESEDSDEDSTSSDSDLDLDSTQNEDSDDSDSEDEDVNTKMTALEISEDNGENVEIATTSSEALRKSDDVKSTKTEMEPFDVDSDNSDISDVDDESDSESPGDSDFEDDDVESTATAMEPSDIDSDPEDVQSTTKASKKASEVYVKPVNSEPATTSSENSEAHRESDGVTTTIDIDSDNSDISDVDDEADSKDSDSKENDVKVEAETESVNPIFTVKKLDGVEEDDVKFTTTALELSDVNSDNSDISDVDDESDSEDSDGSDSGDSDVESTSGSESDSEDVDSTQDEDSDEDDESEDVKPTHEDSDDVKSTTSALEPSEDVEINITSLMPSENSEDVTPSEIIVTTEDLSPIYMQVCPKTKRNILFAKNQKNSGKIQKFWITVDGNILETKSELEFDPNFEETVEKGFVFLAFGDYGLYTVGEKGALELKKNGRREESRRIKMMSDSEDVKNDSLSDVPLEDSDNSEDVESSDDSDYSHLDDDSEAKEDVTTPTETCTIS